MIEFDMESLFDADAVVDVRAASRFTRKPSGTSDQGHKED